MVGTFCIRKETMKQLWNTGLQLYRKYREGIAYLFFGGLATLLNIVLYHLFINMMGMPVAAGNLLDTALCILFAYFTNRTWVFHSRASGRAASREFAQFVSCRLVTALIDECMMIVTVDWIGDALIPASARDLWGLAMKVIANIVVVILNYIFSKRIIFKKKT